MTSLKFAMIAAASLTLTGTAFAQGDPTTDPAAGGAATDPNAGAAPAPAPAAGATMAGPEKKMLVGVDVTGILPLGD